MKRTLDFEKNLEVVLNKHPEMRGCLVLMAQQELLDMFAEKFLDEFMNSPLVRSVMIDAAKLSVKQLEQVAALLGAVEEQGRNAEAA